MAYTIAITGKGGVGKTTLGALLVHRLIGRGCRPVLAVDADPNTCLDAALGVHAATTIGRIREETREIAGKGLATGVAKQQMPELKIAESLVEADDFDLLAMGRPEGAGCYCFANNVLRQAMQTLAANYRYILIDNEAGLENLSRRLVTRIDLLLIVADPSKRGIETLRRLYDLAGEMGVQFSKLAIVLNRLRHPELPAEIADIQRYTHTDSVLALPDDAGLATHNESGRSLRELPADNPVVCRIDAFLDQLDMSTALAAPVLSRVVSSHH